MYESSETAKQAVSESRDILGQPSKESTAWDGLPERDRRVLMWVAGIPQTDYQKTWAEFTAKEKKQIRSAIIRASQWARALGIAKDQVDIADKIGLH